MVSESPCAEPFLPQSMAEILSGRVQRLAWVSLVFSQYLGGCERDPRVCEVHANARLKVVEFVACCPGPASARLVKMSAHSSSTVRRRSYRMN